MLKRPHILVVGSFMMDLIATTGRAERGPTRPFSAPGWEPM